MNELDGTTRALLAASRSIDDPSEEQLSRVERSLMAKIAIGAGASVGVGTATAEAAGAALGVKVAASVVIAGLLVGGGVLVGQHTSTSSQQPASAPSQRPSAPQVVEAPQDVVVPSEPPAPSPASEPEAKRGDKRPESPALKLKAEAALVSDAQRALGAGRAAEALSKLAQYDQRFPSGALRSEADATRVFALCKSGRTREAVAAKESFLRRYPASPAAPRVRSACSAQ